MEEEQGYERFDVDNDYEGGEWIGGEYFYKNKRQKRQQSKDDQIYGVFAGEDEDEDEGRQRGLGNGKRQDYSKPVSFVGGGVVAQGPETNGGNQDGNGKQQQPDKFDNDEEEDRPRMGIGAASAGLGFGAAVGIGFSRASEGGTEQLLSAGQKQLKSSVAPPSRKHGIGSETIELDDDLMPTTFGRRIQKQAEQRRKGKETAQHAQLAQQRAVAKPAGDVGAFEAHTKGIGAKLLAKMGWQEGKGLGKEGRGIAKPLEAKLRPKGLGMGYGDRREPQLVVPSAAGTKKEAEDKQQEETVDVKKEATMWKRRNADVRVKRTFKTADDVLEAAERQPTAAVGPTVIDMRGPQARVVTNLEHLNEVQQTADGDMVPMPELQHNIRLLVDMSEAEIQKLDARIRHQQDTVAILLKEVERLNVETTRHAEQVDRTNIILERLTWARSCDTASLEELIRALSELRESYKHEYFVYDVPAVGLAIVLPHLMKAAMGWCPLQQPAHLAADFQNLRPLLERDAARHSLQAAHDITTSSDPFIRLIMDLVLPPLRKDLINAWDPRDAAALETFIDNWGQVMPDAVLAHVMTHLVLPRLRSQVENWDPINDPVMLHTWVHPWLPYLGHEISELMPVIRFKFASILPEWHPSDESALMMLAPWRQVFTPKDWQQLMSRSVAPRLALGLEEMEINPADQNLEPFEWAMAWTDIMPPSVMASLLEQHFFPKWQAVLRHWLANSPDLDEVTRWYLGWKALFPEELLHQERIRQQLNVAMNIMNAASSGKPIPPQWTSPPHANHDGSEPLYSEAYAGGGSAEKTAMPTKIAKLPAVADVSFKELVEMFAEEQGVEFAPKAGRVYEGMQVYHFGEVSCVVDNAHGLIKALLPGGKWQIVSMEDLASENERRMSTKK